MQGGWVQAGIDTAFRRCFLSPPHSGHRSQTTVVTCGGVCRMPRWLLMCLIPVMSFHLCKVCRYFLQCTRVCLDIVSPPCSFQYLLAQILQYIVLAILLLQTQSQFLEEMWKVRFLPYYILPLCIENFLCHKSLCRIDQLRSLFHPEDMGCNLLQSCRNTANGCKYRSFDS